MSTATETINRVNRVNRIVDVAFWGILIALIIGSIAVLYVPSADRNPVVDAPVMPVAIDLYAPARNADEQVAKDVLAWQNIADSSAAQLVTPDLYAPARNASEQAAKDALVWQRIADGLVAQLVK